MTTARLRLKRQYRKPSPPPPVARRGDDPGEWGPNERGAARVMPPPIENLWVRGLITAEQYQAAHEIERVFHWVTSKLRARIADPSGLRGIVGTQADPLQGAYSARYRPWADELSGNRPVPPDAEQMARVLHSVDPAAVIRLADAAVGQRAPQRPRQHPKTLQFVIEFVVDDRTIETIAEAEKHDHRTVKRALLDGLTRYAEIAGWLRRAA
jgi:hypothetical protein